MSVFEHKIISLLLAWTLLALPAAAWAGNNPRIHPKKIQLLHGVVTDTRTVPAYAAALGASTNPVGELYCLGLDKEIKNSAIFRVETASRYFDLLKWCNGYGTPFLWGSWEQLHVGETIVFRVVKSPTQLSVPRCEKLGLLSKAQAQKTLFNPFDKVYRAHCIYNVTQAYMKVPNERWIFRVVDSGLRSQAKKRRIGASYSASLPPPW